MYAQYIGIRIVERGGRRTDRLGWAESANATVHCTKKAR
jgi:hypothetical protein